MAAFNHSWAEYQHGFGNPATQYFIGLDNLHSLSKNGCKIRFDIQQQPNGTWYYAQYSNFSIGNLSTYYRLSITGYSGDAGDALSYHNGQQFSTYDADHDAHSGNCAAGFAGGFWYNACDTCQITGKPIAWTGTGGSVIGVINVAEVHLIF